MSMIALPADISGDRAAALLPQLRQQIQSQGVKTLMLDGAAVQRFDSAALALLLECRRLAQTAQSMLTVHNLPAGLLSMAHAYGVDALLGLPVAPAVGNSDVPSLA